MVFNVKIEYDAGEISLRPRQKTFRVALYQANRAVNYVDIVAAEILVELLPKNSPVFQAAHKLP